ncbi:probable protein S-acyltransferase 17 [Selaginella moellendorffii]|nr:probable protein S-acyltransferase 17 [Selaginella moellendorffii]|eukprot:XP_002964637.2 probable protein S-acyltransferase 17 [Selaginella moellendorffii]
MELVDILLEEWLLLVYLGFLLFVLVALLCGNWPVFDRTPVRALHSWIGGGACDCVQEILRLCLGSRGVRGYEFVEHICCERPNPILQLFYLSLIVGGFSVFYSTSFKYIPGRFLSSIHRFLGPSAVLVGIAIFLLASFSDPGTITASNLATHEDIYPFDGIIYTEKICPTCNIPRPARSKHCSICNRCIARFDHHCGWMNTCIGANNLRYFVFFLIWHSILCCYGVSLLVAILAGEVMRYGVMERLSFYGMVTFYDKLPHLVQWVITFYNHQVLLLMFLFVVSILLASFLVYHLYLIARNTTTNEVYKWEAYTRWYTDANGKSEDPGKTSKSLWNGCGFWSARRKSDPDRAENIYNSGMARNFGEVLFPLKHKDKVHSKQR